MSMGKHCVHGAQLVDLGNYCPNIIGDLQSNLTNVPNDFSSIYNIYAQEKGDTTNKWTTKSLE